MTWPNIVHNSHDRFYREPFGAAGAGRTVRLRIRIDAGLAAEAVYCVVYLEKEAREERCEMQWERADGSFAVYRAEFAAPERPQLLWYFFEIAAGGGRLYYGKREHGFGGEGQVWHHAPPAWQITVYDPASDVPAWWKDAILYQIFVDRFCNGSEDGRVLSPKPGSVIHAHWGDKPFYIRNERGEVICWDFYGGNLAGVRKKLAYLKSLGVSAIYLNPVFEAPSNHKYDTADYHCIDPMFGDNREFAELCREAAGMGIRIILDGVFSHTGSDSIYFNEKGNYESLGAFQSQDSPYFRWYKFREWPHDYECWWGIKVLPEVNELEPSYLDFVIRGENSVVEYWHEKGISGWRLDVADELPDEFIQMFRTKLKALNPEAVLIGEVWEDASNKISYGRRRDYLLGGELDSVMNYPFRAIAVDFMLGLQDAERTHLALMTLAEHYPLPYFYGAMNLIGSHDVPRILTVMRERLPEWMSDGDKDGLAVRRLKLLMLWQMTFPGVPSVYYGDEAGVWGGADPENRSTYPWGEENRDLLDWAREMAALRRAYDVFRTGSWISLPLGESVYGYVREIRKGRDVFGQARADNAALVVMNRDFERDARVSIPAGEWFGGTAYDVLADEEVALSDGRLEVTLGPLEGKVFLRERWPADGTYDGTYGGIAGLRRRSAGILLHVTSLPSRFGIGDLGPAAYRFVDFLADAGQTWWQILPLHPPGDGDSPYLAHSAFAGSEMLIDPLALAEEGWLDERDLADAPEFAEERTDYERVAAWKEGLLRRAFAVFKGRAAPPDYEAWLQGASWWLEDYALYAALKRHYRGKAWHRWPKSLARRQGPALAKYRRMLAEEIGYQRFAQYVFFRQWGRLKDYAAAKGIRIIGDIPLFVGHDSCDVWVHPELFELDEKGQPVRVAGVPPDYFNLDGQRWGSPLYDWAKMKEDGYGWWKKRLRHLLELVDVVRLDHFRGFEAYWAIPAEEKTAVRGQWVKGPGEDFFAALREEFGELPVFAEDLGFITPEVEELKRKISLSGTKVWQFLTTPWERKCRLPLRDADNVLYTGTHDNDTLRGWFQSARPDLSAEEAERLVWETIEAVYRSCAHAVVVPMQDILCLGTEARMNIPGTSSGNWRWRVSERALSPELARRLKDLAARCGRINH